VTATPAVIEPGPGASLTARDRGALGDHFFRWLALAAGLVVLAILALIAFSTTHDAWPALRHAKQHFVTSDKWVPNDVDGPEGPAKPVFGALAFIYGTALASLIGLVLAVPLCLGLALFITEVAPRRLRGPVVTLLDLLAAVPSVVFGLWGLAVLAPKIGGFYERVHDIVKPIPVVHTIFGPNPQGRSFMTAGIILAVMITPIITSVMREVLMTVPQSDRDGALALGATRWEAIRGVVLPHGFGGLVGAVMLGLGRAMGETIAVALVIGSSAQVTGNLFAPGDAMPSEIMNQFGEATGEFRAALIALGVVLFVMTIIVNVAARGVVAHAERRLRGGT
jgi:phosphate transport system permease protein